MVLTGTPDKSKADKQENLCVHGMMKHIIFTPMS